MTEYFEKTTRIIQNQGAPKGAGMEFFWCPFDLYFDYDNVTETFYRYIGDYAIQTVSVHLMHVG